MLVLKGSFRAIVALYVIAMLLSLFLAWPPPSELPPGGENPGTAGTFLFYVLIATAFFLLIIKIWPWILRYIINALEIFFLLGTTALIAESYGLPMTIPFLSVLARIIWWRSTIVQNVSTIIIISVSTAVVGVSLAPTVATILITLFAIYDYVSVFITKHMVTLAKALGAKADREGRVEGNAKIHMLGAGDIAIPGIFAVSLLRVGIVPAVLAATGATLGLVWTMRLAKRWRRVLPALPSITFVEFIFAAIGLLSSSL